MYYIEFLLGRGDSKGCKMYTLLHWYTEASDNLDASIRRADRFARRLASKGECSMPVWRFGLDASWRETVYMKLPQAPCRVGLLISEITDPGARFSVYHEEIDSTHLEVV